MANIPDGVYEAESFMDDDGVNIGKHIPIKIRVEVKADEMTVDLSGVSPQVAGPYNSGATAGRSASEVAFKFLTTPLLLPINEGSFRPLKIILPPGRVVSATKPAPVRTWMTVPMTVADTIFKALAQATPIMYSPVITPISRRPALFGLDPETGRSFHFPPLLSGGGWGALSDRGRPERDLLHQRRRHPQHAGGSGRRQGDRSLSLYRKLRQDSGGPGKFRGGLGRRPGSALVVARQRIVGDGADDCARLGGSTAARRRWRIVSPSCVKMARCKSYRPAKLPASWRSKPATVFSSKSAAAVAFGIRWNAIRKACSPMCDRAMFRSKRPARLWRDYLPRRATI